MLQSTYQDLRQPSPCGPFPAFLRPVPGLCLLGLLAVVAQGAMAGDIKIKRKTDLLFGRYATSADQGGTVTINPVNGGKTTTGSVYDFGAPHQRGQFEVSGNINTEYSITLPSQITIDAQSGPATMIVDSFTSNPSGTGNTGPGGKVQVYVGATLHLSANQSADVQYTGQFPMTVEYQ